MTFYPELLHQVMSAQVWLDRLSREAMAVSLWMFLENLTTSRMDKYLVNIQKVIHGTVSRI